jgi:hypothetical protein
MHGTMLAFYFRQSRGQNIRVCDVPGCESRIHATTILGNNMVVKGNIAWKGDTAWKGDLIRVSLKERF